MDREFVAILGFVVLFVLMALRIPVGIAMGIVGAGGFGLLVGLDPAISQLGISALSTVTNYAFGLVPLFLLMGYIATESGLSRELYDATRSWLGHRRGGLAMATIGASAGFSAICGSSVATAATMAKVAVPEMRKSGYSGGIACGVVAAGGTLGIIIPPSIILAIYGIIVEQDIGKLFIAGIVPGILAVILHLLTLKLIGWFRPELLPVSHRRGWGERWRTFTRVWAIAVLFLFVIGGIYGGVFSPTEAAGIGAFGAFLISVVRRRLSLRQLGSCLVDTLRTTGSIFTIVLGAVIFGYFLTITQVPQAIADWLSMLPIGPYGVLALLLLVYLVMGCFMDALAMMLLTVPIVFPVVMQLGFDPIWFGIIVVMTVELGLITPPLGMNVFVINSTIPDVGLFKIFRGVMPFVLADIVRLILLVAFPGIVLFLPQTM